MENGYWRFVRTEGRNIWKAADDFATANWRWPGSVVKFREQYGVEVVFRDGLGGEKIPIGVTNDAGIANLPGSWCKPDRHGIRKPYYTNTEGRDMLNSLALKPPELHGLPKYSIEKLKDGGSRVWGTDFFVSEADGYVYARIGPNADYDPDIWFPVSEGGFNKALESSGIHDFDSKVEGFYVINRGGPRYLWKPIDSDGKTGDDGKAEES